MTSALLDHADELFAALAEPNRRLLLERLGTFGVATATTLASQVPVTRQAVTQHLAVLESVNLVSSARTGRERHYTVHVEPLTAAANWMNHVAEQWDARLAVIKALAERPDDQPGESAAKRTDEHAGRESLRLAGLDSR